MLHPCTSSSSSPIRCVAGRSTGGSNDLRHVNGHLYNASATPATSNSNGTKRKGHLDKAFRAECQLNLTTRRGISTGECRNNRRPNDVLIG